MSVVGYNILTQYASESKTTPTTVTLFTISNSHYKIIKKYEKCSWLLFKYGTDSKVQTAYSRAAVNLKYKSLNLETLTKIRRWGHC